MSEQTTGPLGKRARLIKSQTEDIGKLPPLSRIGAAGELSKALAGLLVDIADQVEGSADA
jgi:hypothetical protein